MSKTRPSIKICGITDKSFLEQVQRYAIDAIGLMFYAKSKRAITIEQAKPLLKKISPFLQVVAVFVNPTVEEVNDVLSQLPVHVLQFHGDESDAFCAQFNRPYIKAITMHDELDIASVETRYASASALLLDNAAGGTGQAFDWSWLPANTAKPIIVAGGINALNITELLKLPMVRSIDLSSGVEDMPGHKSIEKLQQLLEVIDETI